MTRTVITKLTISKVRRVETLKFVLYDQINFLSNVPTTGYVLIMIIMVLVLVTIFTKTRLEVDLI